MTKQTSTTQDSLKTDGERIAYELGRRDATKKWNENEGAWVELNKQSVIKHKQELDQARKEERAKILALLVDEPESKHAGHYIDDGYCVDCKAVFDEEHDPEYIVGRNNLRAKLRKAIEQMGEE